VRQLTRIDHDYDDIPGTYVFDAERSRRGYGINMFCMSLLKKPNRDEFKADEAKYLDRYKLSPAQREAILKRQWNRMLELGCDGRGRWPVGSCRTKGIIRYVDELVGASGLDPTRYRQLRDEIANLRENLFNAAALDEPSSLPPDLLQRGPELGPSFVNLMELPPCFARPSRADRSQGRRGGAERRTASGPSFGGAGDFFFRCV
jgi:protocatechuate 4,5-dioxygenase alpha subunit